ncbi:MAG TPA: hypothetical protein VFW03_22785, partial [Gemmatimonadaceae bacterium]|nr:hypothetical protein [Gemmatimonadaceae bacterium]
LCCTGSSEGAGPTTAACQRLRDHVVDVRVAEIHQDREAHRTALRTALGARFVTECLNQSSARFDCEMKAATIDGLRACAAAE